MNGSSNFRAYRVFFFFIVAQRILSSDVFSCPGFRDLRNVGRWTVCLPSAVESLRLVCR